ncbi:MAG: serine/threonine protein kinase, partial [Deltaproteobacteria bacterium]|nr:serine/threonine protein kinase [Deltaproteobacteria bacterium]MBW2532190.1 serine/threonine protein kinase [Deltaproteobacteria bacterium]
MERGTVRVLRRRGANADCLHANTLTALSTGDLAGDRAQAALAHAASCAPCRELLEALRAGARLVPDPNAAPESVTCVTAVRTTHPESRQPPPSTQFEPGQTVDHFEIVRLIGRGGMGAVYMARDTKLERSVALKVITSEELREPTAIKRFMREAKTTARVSHPSIVTIHTVGEHQGVPYLALEYIDGISLRKWMAERRTLEEIVEVCATIADALAEAHRHGVLHRDLKPENVRIDRKGRARVLDFGIAETVHTDEPPSSAHVVAGPHEVGPIVTGMAGTPRYMAPEQWREAACSGATDVWALGVLLYEMLTGAHPFGAGRDQVALLQAVLSADESIDIAPLENVSEPIRLLVRQCLLLEPSERPTAEHLAEALRATVTVTSRPALPASAEPVAAPRPRHRGFWVAGLGAAALALGGVFAFIALGDVLPEDEPGVSSAAAAPSPTSASSDTDPPTTTAELQAPSAEATTTVTSVASTAVPPRATSAPHSVAPRPAPPPPP